MIKPSHFIALTDLQQLRLLAQSPLSVQRLYHRNRILQKSCPCCQAAAIYTSAHVSAFQKCTFRAKSFPSSRGKGVNLLQLLIFSEQAFGGVEHNVHMFQLDHVGVL